MDIGSLLISPQDKIGKSSSREHVCGYHMHTPSQRPYFNQYDCNDHDSYTTFFWQKAKEERMKIEEEKRREDLKVRLRERGWKRSSKDREEIVCIAKNNIAALDDMIRQIEKTTLPENIEYTPKPSCLWKKLYTVEGIMFSLKLHSNKNGWPVLTPKTGASYFALPDKEKQKVRERIKKEYGRKRDMSYFFKRLERSGYDYLNVDKIKGQHMSNSFKPHYNPVFEIEPITPIIHSAIFHR